jgi:hypothetical protein
VKSTVHPPQNGLVANVKRKSNPFSSDVEPDWVPSTGDPSIIRDGKPLRKPALPPRTGSQDQLRDSSPMVQTNPGQQQPNRIPEKSPPAVPRKPMSLSSPSEHRSPSHFAGESSSPGQSTAKATASPANLLDGTGAEQIEWKPLLPQ